MTSDDRSAEAADARLLLTLAAAWLQEYLDKIRHSVALLDEEQVWWRPHPGSNAVGNLLLHLCGNLTQWMLCGLGGEEDHRQRSAEFLADRSLPKAELVRRLVDVVGRCRTTLAGLSAEDLARPRVIQGAERSGLEALLHPVEHMSYHTGQVVLLAKQLAGDREAIDFYPELKGT